MNRPGPLNIIYDGHCGFCLRLLKIVRVLDRRRAVRFYDSHQAETFELFPQLLHADVANAMYAVREGEPLYRGFYGVRRLLWSVPLMWPLIPLFYLPGMSILGTRIYAWVARNRYHFGCGSETCALPAELPRAPEKLR
jgi:predicted DCC family thiol-disulfide oxidoreductase YuxK